MINIGTTFVDGLPVVTLKMTTSESALISSMTPIQALLLGQDLINEARRVERLRAAPEAAPVLETQSEPSALAAAPTHARGNKRRGRQPPSLAVVPKDT